MNINEIENIYGKLPPFLDIKKVNAVLDKRYNKHPVIDDIYTEILEFLNTNTIVYSQVHIPYVLTNNVSVELKSIDLGKVTLLIIDDYTIFHKKVLAKDFVEKMHFSIIKAGSRPIWIKKFEWEDRRKQTVLKSLILHACGKTKERIYARNTYTDIVPSKSLADFFDTSSFYGHRNASFAVCLKDKSTHRVLMAMNFGHPYYGKDKYGDNAIECIRAACQPFTLVVGGMSKLMKFMIAEFGSTFATLVYYIDDSHYSANSMGTLGFTYSHFAGGGLHNVWKDTGAMFMRTPAMHKEISFFRDNGHILTIPDVGNSTYLLKPDTIVGHADSVET